jgi:molybdopterin synthase sulfur carrier subunit
MAIRVHIPGPLRPAAGGASELEVEAADVGSLVKALTERHPGLKERLCDGQGALRTYVRVFVNDEDVRFLEGERTPLRAGDAVSIVPAIAGG